MFGLLATILFMSLEQTVYATSALARAGVAESSQMRVHQEVRRHEMSLAKMINSMTLSPALEVLRETAQRKGNDEVLGLVQEALQTGGVKRGLKVGHAAGKHSHKQIQEVGGRPRGYSGVDKAKEMLNEMIEEVQEKYDLELQKCCAYDESQSILIEESRQDISMFNAEAAEARKEVLDAQAQISMCETKLPQLAEALVSHNHECQAEMTELRALLKIVNADLTVMSSILQMTDCAKPVALISCVDECTGQPHVSFNHASLQQTASKLQGSTRDLLDAYLADEFHAGDSEDVDIPYGGASNFSMEVPKMSITRSGPCKAPVPVDKRTGKCSVSSNPNCAKMQEKFMYIQGGIEDKRDELMDQMAKLEADCKHTQENLQAQIAFFEGLLKDQQTALAGATKKQNNAEESTRLKTIELKELTGDYAQMTETCHNNYQTLEGEECGIKKIRGELYKMQGQDNPAFFQDCVVSEWLLGECSASCGGGIMTMKRTIVTHPVGGSKCPLLVAQKPCNEQKCPIDCRLEDWEGWSGCSAKCGGGIMERDRYVEVEAEHGGEPCGETSEAQSCNVQSCDKDCELSDWKTWGMCSKQCNGGTSTRTRTINEPAVGDGWCPRMFSDYRIQERMCNTDPCVPAMPSRGLICNSRRDIILVLDGSASGGQEGWDDTIHAGAQLARAFGAKNDGSTDGGVQLAVILFSSEVEIVQHFSQDAESVASKIEGLAWPNEMTMTAQALDAAKSELSLGRADAESVVIVITDGRPLSMRKTRRASKRLRRQARLVWIPISQYAPLRAMKRWASRPRRDNFLALNSYDELLKSEVVNRIVSDVCPEVI